MEKGENKIKEKFLTKVFSGVEIGSSEDEAKNIFKTGINPSIRMDASREALILEGYQINEDSTFKTIFSKFGKLSERFLSRGQIAGFCNRNSKKLSKNTTFFLTKKGKEYFVVPVDKNGPHEPCRFDCQGTWLGANCNIVVVPQKNNKK